MEKIALLYIRHHFFVVRFHDNYSLQLTIFATFYFTTAATAQKRKDFFCLNLSFIYIFNTLHIRIILHINPLLSTYQDFSHNFWTDVPKKVILIQNLSIVLIIIIVVLTITIYTLFHDGSIVLDTSLLKS